MEGQTDATMYIISLIHVVDKYFGPNYTLETYAISIQLDK